MEKRDRLAPPRFTPCPPPSPTPPCTADLETTLAFYTSRLGFEVRYDVPISPTMRWLTVAGPGAEHQLLLAAVDQHVPPVDRDAMRELVAKGIFPVFVRVDDVDAVFEALRADGVEVLQEPIDQAYGLRDAAVRDPTGNMCVSASQPLPRRAPSGSYRRLSRARDQRPAPARCQSASTP